jgi:hypothetical protein
MGLIFTRQQQRSSARPLARFEWSTVVNCFLYGEDLCHVGPVNLCIRRSAFVEGSLPAVLPNDITINNISGIIQVLHGTINFGGTELAQTALLKSSTTTASARPSPSNSPATRRIGGRGLMPGTIVTARSSRS